MFDWNRMGHPNILGFMEWPVHIFQTSNGRIGHVAELYACLALLSTSPEKRLLKWTNGANGATLFSLKHADLQGCHVHPCTELVVGGLSRRGPGVARSERLMWTSSLNISTPHNTQTLHVCHIYLH